MVDRILPQVDRLFVFLDGFDETPACLVDREKVTLARSQDRDHAFHASGRFLVFDELAAPSVIVVVDDDIDYPPDYVHRLVLALADEDGCAAVGVHGGHFLPPYRNVLTDVDRIHFADGVEHAIRVDELGSGTMAFLSGVFHFDIQTWPTWRANDLMIAIEARNRGLSLVCVARPKAWLRALAEDQPDSLWVETKRDPAPKNALMRRLMAEAVTRFEAPPTAALPPE